MDYASAANKLTALATALPGEAAVAAPAGYAATVTTPGGARRYYPGLSSGRAADPVVVSSGNTQAIAEGFKTRQVPQ